MNLQVDDLAIVGGQASLDLHGSIIRIKKLTNNTRLGILYQAVFVDPSPQAIMRAPGGPLNGNLKNLSPTSNRYLASFLLKK